MQYLKCRYSCFARLHSVLRARFPDLPPMPEKSFFRKRLSPDFMAERRRLLEKLLVAAIASDPAISDPDLRQFLGDALLNVETAAQCRDHATVKMCTCGLADLAAIRDDADLSTSCEDDESGVADADEVGEDNEEEFDVDDGDDGDSIFSKLAALRAANARLETENALIVLEVASHEQGGAAALQSV